MLTKRVLTIAFALALLVTPALAGSSKEMIELQTQVQQLLKMQQTIDEKMGVLQENMKTLTQQTNDALARVTASADKVDKAITRENAASDSCVDQLTGQAQPLHDALTELKASVAAMNRQLNELSGARQGAAQQQGALPTSQPSAANPHQ